MGQSVKISDYIVDEARVVAKALNRSVAGQVEYWAKLGKLSEENPDLSYGSIKDILFVIEDLHRRKLKKAYFPMGDNDTRMQEALESIEGVLIELKVNLER